jgi:hypothetical protein
MYKHDKKTLQNMNCIHFHSWKSGKTWLYRTTVMLLLLGGTAGLAEVANQIEDLIYTATTTENNASPLQPGSTVLAGAMSSGSYAGGTNATGTAYGSTNLPNSTLQCWVWVAEIV